MIRVIFSLAQKTGELLSPQITTTDQLRRLGDDLRFQIQEIAQTIDQLPLAWRDNRETTCCLNLDIPFNEAVIDPEAE